MISRLTTFAAAFAVLATASLAFAADLHQGATAAHTAAAPAKMVQLEPVLITGKRVQPAAR